MLLHISHGVPTAMQSVQNVQGEGAGSGWNGTLGRKRAGIPLGNLVGNFLYNLLSFLMVEL